MKLKFLCFALGLACYFDASAGRVIFDYRVFHAPGEGPYVEFVTSFDAATFQHTAADSGLVQAHAELNLIVSRLGQIVDFRKVKVDGPMVRKGEEADFLSVERFMLGNGVFDLEVEVMDMAAGTGVKESMTQRIEINNPSDGVFISDIQFVSAYRQSTDDNAFSKSGYDLLPYVSNYFPSSLNSLIFYAEMYRTDSVFGNGAGFLSTVCVIDAMDNAIENCKRMKREKAAAVVPTLQVLDISDLPTGEYKVRLEVRNRDNQLVYMRERNFTRSKIKELDLPPADIAVSDATVATSFAAEFSNRDSLYAMILWHIPIAGDIEKNTIDNQLEKAELLTLQSFLYNFWY
jgi:hypothetical protein